MPERSKSSQRLGVTYNTAFFVSLDPTKYNVEIVQAPTETGERRRRGGGGGGAGDNEKGRVRGGGRKATVKI